MKLLFENWKRYLTENLKSIHTAKMSPEDFLVLTRGEDDDVMSRAKKIVRGGYDPTKAGTLSLVVKVCPREVKVVNHEGRARAAAAMQAGLKEVPVSFTLLNCEGDERIETLELDFGGVEIVSQFSDVSIPSSNVKPWTPDNTLGFDDKVEMPYKKLMSKISVANFRFPGVSYADFVPKLTSEYIFRDPDGKELELDHTIIYGLRQFILKPEPQEDEVIEVTTR